MTVRDARRDEKLDTGRRVVKLRETYKLVCSPVGRVTVSSEAEFVALGDEPVAAAARTTEDDEKCCCRRVAEAGRRPGSGTRRAAGATAVAVARATDRALEVILRCMVVVRKIGTNVVGGQPVARRRASRLGPAAPRPRSSQVSHQQQALTESGSMVRKTNAS